MKLNITILILLIVLIISNIGNMYLSYSINQEQINLKAAQRITNESDYKNCMDETIDAYYASWNEKCNDRGWGENCKLPAEIANNIKLTMSFERLNCIRHFMK